MIKLPSGVEINSLICMLRSIGWEAYETIIYYYQILEDSNNKINILKNDDTQNPVTLADLKVNDSIVQRINEKYKDISWEILTEENEKDPTKFCNINADWMWVLDPLDGTKDFIQKTGHFAVHLALNFIKKPIIGMVLLPSKNELWIANGTKVWCEDHNGFKRDPNLSSAIDLREMTLVSSKNHSNKVLKDLIEKIGFNKTIIMGSIGCKVAAILRGEADIYIALSLPGKSAPKDWDFAAPLAILEQAGGAITDIENNPLVFCGSEFRQEGLIIATNNKNNHKNICLEIKKVIQENNFLIC